MNCTPLFLVESYWPGVRPQDVAAADAQMAQVAGAEQVRHLGSMLVPQDEWLMRLFLGGCEEVVAATNRRAGIPVERVMRVLMLGPVGSVTEPT